MLQILGKSRHSPVIGGVRLQYVGFHRIFVVDHTVSYKDRIRHILVFRDLQLVEERVGRSFPGESGSSRDLLRLIRRTCQLKVFRSVAFRFGGKGVNRTVPRSFTLVVNGVYRPVIGRFILKLLIAGGSIIGLRVAAELTVASYVGDTRFIDHRIGQIFILGNNQTVGIRLISGSPLKFRPGLFIHRAQRRHGGAELARHLGALAGIEGVNDSFGKLSAAVLVFSRNRPIISLAEFQASLFRYFKALAFNAGFFDNRIGHILVCRYGYGVAGCALGLRPGKGRRSYSGFAVVRSHGMEEAGSALHFLQNYHPGFVGLNAVDNHADVFGGLYIQGSLIHQAVVLAGIVEAFQIGGNDLIQIHLNVLAHIRLVVQLDTDGAVRRAVGDDNLRIVDVFTGRAGKFAVFIVGGVYRNGYIVAAHFRERVVYPPQRSSYRGILGNLFLVCGNDIAHAVGIAAFQAALDVPVDVCPDDVGHGSGKVDGSAGRTAGVYAAGVVLFKDDILAVSFGILLLKVRNVIHMVFELIVRDEGIAGPEFMPGRAFYGDAGFD